MRAMGLGWRESPCPHAQGVPWPLDLFPHGSKENLLLTVISRATCEEGPRGIPLSAAPSSPRIAQKGYSDCVLWGMWSCLGRSSWGFA